jgi:hypothetical protein
VRSSVTHERLDDEVIAIDLESGSYFALDDVAADCWSILAGGGSLDAAVDAVVERFDVAPDTARSDVEWFAEQLVREQLLEPSDAAPISVPAPRRVGRTCEYRRPAIERFNDLEELLLLDPIHEVDEAGWPVTRTA